MLRHKSKKYKKYQRDGRFLTARDRVYSMLQCEPCTEQLKVYSYLHYEKLKYEYSGLSSVRVMNGRVERLLFHEYEDGIEISLIEIDETHYGQR